MSNPAVLITGASGLLGYALCRSASMPGTIVGIYHVHKPLFKGGRWIQMDLTDHTALIQCIKSIKPRGIIHTAAASQTGQCQTHATETENINVLVPGLIADVCADMDIPMVFTSTDLVFNGLQPPYREESPPQPVNIYGEQKARAEELVLERWPKALVCRMPLMIGAAPNAGNNFTLKMIEAIAHGRPVNLFNDEYRTPVDIWSAARGIFQFFGRRHGLLHLGGRTRLSRLDIGIKAARSLGVAPTMIQSIAAANLPNSGTRAPDCSLDSRRAFGLGYTPAALQQGIQRAVDHWRRIAQAEEGSKPGD